MEGFLGAIQSLSLQDFRRSTAYIAFTIAFAVFTEQFLYAVIVPVAPFALEQRIHVPKDQVQYWVSVLLATYGAASLLSSAPWGWYSDRTQSRRQPLLIGLILMLASTVLLWLARTPFLMVIGRICQGVASTVVWTTGLAMMIDRVGEARIGEYMGYIGIALNLGTLTGPMLGGIAFARLSYDAVFSICIGFVAIDVGLRLFMIEKPSTGHGPGYMKLTDLQNDQDHDLSGLESKTHVTLHPVPVAQVHTRGPSRLPAVLSLLASPRCLSALWGVFVQTTVFASFQAVLPLALHNLFGWSSTGAGLVYITLVIPGLTGPLIGKLSDRVGPRWPAAIGFMVLCPALLLLREIKYNTTDEKVALCEVLVLAGVGLTFILEPLMAEITYLAGACELTTTDDEGRARGSYAQGFALFNLAYSMGDTFGPLLAGYLMETGGLDALATTLGVVAGLSAIPQILICGGWIFEKKVERLPTEAHEQ